MPRRETVIGVTAAGVLAIAVASALVRGGEPSIDTPIGAPTPSASESSTTGLPTTEPTTPAPTEPSTSEPSEPSEPAASESGHEPTSGTEQPSETASPTASPTTTASPTDEPSEDGEGGLDDMPDTGGGALALLGGAVAAFGAAVARRRT